MTLEHKEWDHCQPHFVIPLMCRPSSLVVRRIASRVAISVQTITSSPTLLIRNEGHKKQCPTRPPDTRRPSSGFMLHSRSLHPAPHNFQLVTDLQPPTPPLLTSRHRNVSTTHLHRREAGATGRVGSVIVQRRRAASSSSVAVRRCSFALCCQRNRPPLHCHSTTSHIRQTADVRRQSDRRSHTKVSDATWSLH